MNENLEAEVKRLKSENADLKLKLIQSRINNSKNDKWTQNIIDTLPNPVFIKNAKHQFLSFNKAFASLLHTEPEELLGKTDFDFMPPEESKVFWKNDSEVLENGLINWSEEQLTTNGTTHTILTSKVRIEDENGDYYVLGAIADITDNKSQQAILLKKKNEIEKQREHIKTLLKEIHHRVKNNLQIINSLLNLQLSKFDNPVLEEVIENSKNRIFSMAKVHEILCENENLSHINLNDYLRTLIQNLERSLNPGKSISFNINVLDVFLNIESAIPLGLLVNEVITNSIKHANTPENIVEIYVQFSREEDSFILELGDDGITLPNEKYEPNLGTELIALFVEQLNGNLTRPERNRGFHYSLKFTKLQDFEA